MGQIFQSNMIKLCLMFWLCACLVAGVPLAGKEDRKRESEYKSHRTAKQRIAPLDPLSEVRHPKGFPNATMPSPPPKPSDPIEFDTRCPRCLGGWKLWGERNRGHPRIEIPDN